MRTGWPASPSPISSARLGRLIAALLLVTALWAPPAAGAAGPSVITLTFVRHAESLGNASGIVDTSTPGPPLSALGWVQAFGVAPGLAADGHDGLYASTMVRTQQTAEPLGNLLGEPVTVLPGLREIEAGVFEGEPEATLGTGYFTAPEQWLRGDRSARIPGSIDGDEFDARFDAAVQQIYASGAVNPVAFAHGGSIMVWVTMNVDNPDPALLIQRPLRNTARVVLTGSPAAGWTLVEWDGIPVAG
ncbi:histidine phosphatase family protein [Mycolicibacterium thermoresistibile]